MNNEQFVFTPYAQISEDEKPRDLIQILKKYSYHWPLFAISIFLALAIAWFYIGQTKPVYHVKAKLSIKDEKKATPEKALLQELDLTSSPKLIENEIEVLKSRPLIRQVVNELQLWITYSESAGYRSIDLYKDSPLSFVLLKPSGNITPRTYEITINSADRFTITKANGEILTASFKNTLTSDFGTWKLNPASNLNQYIDKTITISLQNPEKAVTNYQNNIVSVLNKTAPIVELAIDDEAPQRGRDVLNHLIAAYKNYNISDKNKETESTLKFIDERLASLTGELTDVEKNVEGYKSSIGLTDISSQSQFYLENVQSNDSQLNEVNVQLNVIEGIENYVKSSSGSENTPATIGITDPGLISLVDQLTRLQLQREKLLAITPEENPIFVPINKQIKSTKAAIKENIGGIKNSLLATRRQLAGNNSRLENSIKNIPGQERQYVSIKRQQGIKESLYIYLLQKREEVALSYASTLTDARTVEEAYYEEPQSEKGFPIAMALLFGTLLPAGLIYSRDVLRNRILSRKEIEAKTSVPVICELSQQAEKMPLVVLSGNAYAIGEQFRALRTNLLQTYNHKEKGKVTLFTSSIAGEGKSFVSTNIAASVAMSGRKTIILELDLRKPKISKIFNLTQQQPGLSDLLSGRATKDEITRPSGIHPNLYVMSAGSTPDNPSELLGNKEMADLIDDLRFEYDNIIIDSPPLHLVTDAMVVAPLCDISLFVVRHNFTPKSELEFIEEVFKSKKLPNMKLIFRLWLLFR